MNYVSIEYVICLMYLKVFHFFAVLTIYYAKLRPALLFGIVCNQQSCTLLEYCIRLTYSKVFHFFEMWYMWHFALLSCSFPQFTMLNCTELLLEIVHSQQSCTLLEYCICLMYLKVSCLFLMYFYKLLSICIN